MGEIDFTNIIIDDFRKGKHNPFNKYVYILTHVHTDHLRGLSNSWNYGPIYCSQLTCYLILNKFPDLKHVLKPLPLEEPTSIPLSDELYATVTLFDANHCAGAVLVLLEGYFGRFLYSGDFRFNEKKFRTYSYLYPPQMSNPRFEKCSLQIDKLWLDNTFCNPRFTFPAQEDCFKLIEDFVRENLGKKVYIGMDYYGKEEALVHIARVFDTIIVVDEQRYETIITMGFDREYFTTNPDEGLIEVVTRRFLHDRLIEHPQALGLVMSGWANKPVWKNVRGEGEQKRIYFVPYSLHSNYNEIVGFVRSIQPSAIDPVVPLDEKPQEEIAASFTSMYSVKDNAESFRSLVKKYLSPPTPEFQKNCEDTSFHEVIKRKLGLDRKTAEINKTELGLTTFHMPARGRGYKINQNRDEQEIQKVKEQLQRKREARKNKKCQIVISEDEDQSDDEVEIIEKVNEPEQQIVIQEEEQQKNLQMQQKYKQNSINKCYEMIQEAEQSQKQNQNKIPNTIIAVETQKIEAVKKAKGKQRYTGKIKEIVKTQKKQRNKTKPNLSAFMNVPMLTTNQERETEYFQQIKKLLETISQAVSMINSLQHAK